jgi:hypothetical protein
MKPVPAKAMRPSTVNDQDEARNRGGDLGWDFVERVTRI